MSYLLIGIAAVLGFINAGADAAEYVVSPDGSALIVLTPEEVKLCDNEGGCNLITQATMDKIQEALKKQHKAASKIQT